MGVGVELPELRSLTNTSVPRVLLWHASETSIDDTHVNIRIGSNGALGAIWNRCNPLPK